MYQNPEADPPPPKTNPKNFQESFNTRYIPYNCNRTQESLTITTISENLSDSKESKLKESPPPASKKFAKTSQFQFYQPISAENLPWGFHSPVGCRGWWRQPMWPGRCHQRQPSWSAPRWSSVLSRPTWSTLCPRPLMMLVGWHFFLYLRESIEFINSKQRKIISTIPRIFYSQKRITQIKRSNINHGTKESRQWTLSHTHSKNP